ncbi:MAG: WD40 repeat domain-containing serine/threonine protein kinase [Planctomycetota bacterium]
MDYQDPREAAVAADVARAIFEALEAGREPELPSLLSKWPNDERIVREEWSAVFDGEAPVVDHDSPLRIGRFRIHRVLGRGGQGVVYLAEDELLGRPVALKLVTKNGPGAFDAVTRAKREANVLAKLRHRAICEIFDFVDCGESHGIVLRFVDGTSLAEVCSRPCGELDAAEWDRRLGILIDVADGLIAAHEVGVIHRDIKPGNVILGLDGQAVILDFGLARPLSSEATPITRTGGACGTPQFMAPEQWSGARGVDTRVDVFALGMLIATLLNQGPISIGVTIDWENARTSLESSDSSIALDPAVIRIVRRATQFHPDDRYPDVASLRSDLVRLRSGAGIGRLRSPSVASVWRRLRRRPLVFRLVTSLILAVAVGAWGLIEHSSVQAQVRESNTRVQYRDDVRSTLELLQTGELEAARARFAGLTERECGPEHSLLSRRLRSGAQRAWLGSIDGPVDLMPNEGGWILRECTGRALQIDLSGSSVLTDVLPGSTDPGAFMASAVPADHERGASWQTRSGVVLATWSPDSGQRRSLLRWAPAGRPDDFVEFSVRGYVTAATGSRDGLRIHLGVRGAGGNESDELRLLDAGTGEELSRCAIPSRATALTSSPDESSLIVGLAGGEIRTMDVWLRQRLAVDNLHAAPIVALSIHPKTGHRLSLDRSGACILAAVDLPMSVESAAVLQVAGLGESSVISGTRQLLFPPSRPGAPVAMCDPVTGRLTQHLTLHNRDRVIAFAHARLTEQTYLAIGAASSTLLRFGRDGSRESVTGVEDRGAIRKLAVSDDGRRLALLHDDGELRILEGGHSRSVLVASRLPDVERLSWSSDGDCLGFAARSGRLGVHDCALGDQRTLMLDREIVDFAISRKAQRLFVADPSGAVRVLHLIDGLPLFDLCERATPILRVALIDEDSRLVVVRADGAVEFHVMDPLHDVTGPRSQEPMSSRPGESSAARVPLGSTTDPLEHCARRLAFGRSSDGHFTLPSGPLSILTDPSCGRRWYELAERVMQRRVPVEPSRIVRLGLGAAALRTGNPLAAIEHLRAAAEDERALHGQVQPMTLAFLVMAQHAAGDHPSAEHGLARLRDLLGDRFEADPLAVEAESHVCAAAGESGTGLGIARVPSLRLRRSLGWIAVSSPGLDRAYVEDVIEWYRLAGEGDGERVDALLLGALRARVDSVSTRPAAGADSVEYSPGSEIECALAALVLWESNDVTAARLACNRFSAAARRSAWFVDPHFEDWLRATLAR